MRFFLFVFVLMASLNVAAQSPTASGLFSDGTKFAEQDKFDQALESYQSALEVAENEHTGATYRAMLHYNIGVCYFRLERFKLAANQFKSAILLKNDYTRAHYALGIAELRIRSSYQAKSER